MVIFSGKIADVFSCDKHLVNGVALRVSLQKRRPEFTLTYDDEAKGYKVSTTQVNLFVRKKTAADNVHTAIETTLTKMPALYRYTETISKSYLLSTNAQSWDQEDIFHRKPSERLVLTMTTSAGFLGAKQTNKQNPFHYHKFGLCNITVYRNANRSLVHL